MSKNVFKKTLLKLTSMVLLISLFLVLALSFYKSNSMAEEIIINQIGIESEINKVVNEVNAYESGNRERITKEAKREKRSFYLKDFNNKKIYLYVEFDQGGYAIYDRLGEFIYERSESGEGPFKAYSKNNNLYYGGPAKYFVKISNYYLNTISGEKITKIKGNYYTKNNQNTRSKVKERKNEESLLIRNSVSSYANNEITSHYLGENLPSNINDGSAQFYFPILSFLTNINLNDSFPNNTIPMDDFLTYGGVDAVFGLNKYGSCSVVALAMVMQYYERMGYGNMVPDDISNFHLMYDYIFISNYFIPNWLSNIDRSMLKAEFLHQELLYILFPQERGNSANYTKDTFGIHLTNMRDGLTAYFNTYSLPVKTTSHRNNDNGMESEIKKGNPVMTSIIGEYRLQNDDEMFNIDSHSVVAYGYTSKKINLINRTQEYIVNFGWYMEDYGSIYINSSVPYANMNINVF